MNKRFFTFMVAALLAGAPLANQAFAGTKTAVALTSTASIASGLKFVLTDNPASPAAYVKVVDVTGTNYVTFTGTDATLAADGANFIEKAAVFEVRSFAGGKFQLWVNGKQFVTNAAGNAYSLATPDDIVKEFVPKASTAATSKCDFDNIWTYQVGGTGTAVWGAAKPATISESFDASDFNSYNSNATTLSFDAPNLVGNVFEGLVPVTFTGVWGGKFNPGTYFVSGSADDIKAFIKSGATPTNIQRAAAKLKFAFISGSKYELNAAKAGEAYSLIMLPGSEFYKTTGAANPDHANFTAKTVDNLNNEDVIQLSATLTVGTTSYAVNIAAVKTSGSDASSYVTTVLQTGSAFSAVNPTLGSNTYLAASEFLSSEKSVYNIYFTSGKQSVKDGIVTEYHKYLAVTSDLGSPTAAFEAIALAADDIQLDSPLAQWVATGFYGKYTLTLTNRQTQDKLVLKLQPTTTPGVYQINGNPSTGLATIANLDDKDATNGFAERSLGDKKIMLIKTTTTKTDGFLELSKDEMASGVVLAFSGKSAALGETTFFAAANTATAGSHTLYPTQDVNKAALLNISKAEDVNGDAKYVLNELNYAYLDAKGVVATDKVDTLAMPVYNLSYSYTVSGVPQTDLVTNQALAMTTAPAAPVDLFFQKAMDGSYVMTNTGTTLLDIKSVAAGWNVTGVNGSVFQANYTNLFAPSADRFANIDVLVCANEDRTSLEATSRHATLECTEGGAISFRENKNGILEGILSAEPMTFWLDTANSETTAPAFYISKGIAAAEEEAPATKADEAPVMRNFLFYAADSLNIFNEGSAMATTNEAYRLEGTSDLKAIFRPAALIGEDTLATVVDGKEVILKGAVKPFQFGVVLADEDVEGEYVIYAKANPSKYLYSHNGKLGFGSDKKAMVFTIGEGDPTANEAIAAESGVQVIGGQGVVTVQGAAGKVVTVANILGQTIANQVAASDNVTIAVPAGIVVVAVDGEATKVVVK